VERFLIKCMDVKICNLGVHILPKYVVHANRLFGLALFYQVYKVAFNLYFSENIW